MPPTPDGGAVARDFLSAARSYSGGVIMGFQSVGSDDFISANLDPRLFGRTNYHVRVPLLVVDPISGCVRSTIPNQFLGKIWLEAESEGVPRRATLFVDGVEVDAGEPCPIFTRGCVTVGTGAVPNPFTIDAPNRASQYIALPFKGKIAAARVWGRPVRDIRALLEMKEDGGLGHVILDGAEGGTALLQRTADLRRGRRVDWSPPERGSGPEEFGHNDGVVCYFPILSDFCERVALFGE
ncbi:hypothetical protein DFJ73DRAFT_773614 [Zopfochytrium polystomum]|nr:hypothetical protein DFJ73DRAFT_773614 [Zopfochytrium polystomum]